MRPAAVGATALCGATMALLAAAAAPYLPRSISSISSIQSKPPKPPATRPLLDIGVPDGSTLEFGLAEHDYTGYSARFPRPVVFRAGTSSARDWPFIHPSTHDAWAGGRPHVHTVRFHAPADTGARAHTLHIGLLAVWEPSILRVKANGQPVHAARLPSRSLSVNLAFQPSGLGDPFTVSIPVPAGSLRPGDNELQVSLDDGSWVVYDYVRLTGDPAPPRIGPDKLLAGFRAGPMRGVDEIVFAVRQPGQDGHWYANFAYDANDPAIRMYADGGRLCVLSLRTGKVRTLVEDARGGIRDPQVHCDGRRIVFSWRRGGDEHYNLWVIAGDGSGLRRITNGPFDDFEPAWLPGGGIVFVSSRCNRWVNCWRTPVAVMYRCEEDGSDIQQISANIEHDNTPWPLPDGRLLYTRWEYIDRSQVDYHHLWTVNPDGTEHNVYFGNMRPGTVMIDAKPIPGSRKIVASFSPGHGATEHDGQLYVVDPVSGPDDPSRAQPVSRTAAYRDPWAFSEDCFLAASGSTLAVMNQRGWSETIFRLSAADVAAGLQVHEPRPLAPRPRERVMSVRTQWYEGPGRFILQDVTHGRRMTGVAPGDVKKLLVLESLPKPVNFTGGMEPLSYGGTFTLERILGTVPVEADGSAYFEAPSLRSLLFVALDANDAPVKRMQSFTSVQPGETLGCIGCHEQRVRTGRMTPPFAAAVRRPPSAIEPIAGVPDVLDYPRDIQPILDRHCVRCHDWGTRAGRVCLSGDRGPIYSHSYFTLFARNLVSDGRNRARSNYPPRGIGSSASRLMSLLDGSHHEARPTEAERRIVHLWIETGAPYPGTYAALGTGMVGGYRVNALDRGDTAWPSTRDAADAMRRRCAPCHTGPRALPDSVSDDQGRQPWVDMSPDDPRRTYANHLLYNLTRPESSLLLLAPLARSAGGYGACKSDILKDRQDPDYARLLAAITDAGKRLDTIKRFDMPGFQPHPGWVREMKRYGILPADADPASVDPYAVERKYWESLWHKGL